MFQKHKLSGAAALTALAWVATVDGVLELDVDDERVLGAVDVEVARDVPELGLPRLVAASAARQTVVALVDRKPPLLVSQDGGSSWSEAGGGLPAGFDVAVDPDDPDRVLYAARNRVYLSETGGRFWRSLDPELPDVEAVAWATGS